MIYRYEDRFMVAVAQEMGIAAGDRFQLKFNGKSVEGDRQNNGELVTVREVARDGSLVVEAGARGAGARKRSHRLNAPRARLRSHVLRLSRQNRGHGDHADTANRAAADAHQWYVGISRGRKQMLVFTPDKEALRSLSNQGGHD